MLTATEHMEHARMSAHDSMSHARADIDALFGPGYAHANPGLVAAYITAAATAFQAGWGLQELALRLDGIAEAIDALRPE